MRVTVVGIGAAITKNGEEEDTHSTRRLFACFREQETKDLYGREECEREEKGEREMIHCVSNPSS
jgi:hypothetical protein